MIERPVLWTNLHGPSSECMGQFFQGFYERRWPLDGKRDPGKGIGSLSGRGKGLHGMEGAYPGPLLSGGLQD